MPLVGAVVCAAALPLLALVTGNAHTHSFARNAVFRSLSVLVGCALLTCLVFTLLLRRVSGGLVAACLFWWGLLVLPLLVPVIHSAAWRAGVIVGAATIVAVVAGRAASRPWPAILAIFTLVAVSTLVVQLAWLQQVPPPGAALAEVDALTRDAGRWAPSTDRRPDLYFVVLDGLTSPAVLASRFGIDTEPAVRQMESAGARVVRNARSNYTQTYLSLASSLNMNYLDRVAGVMGDAKDRRPLVRAIEHSGVIGRLREIGYEFVYVGSDASILPDNGQADRCLCPLPPGPSDLDSALLSNLGLRLPAFEEWALDGHRDHVLQSLATISTLRSTRPMVVFAHVLAPHPPFVLGDEAGRSRAFSFSDGDEYPGTSEDYARGYAAQARRMLEEAGRFVASLSARERPVVAVVVGDHGSGLGLHNTRPDATDASERLRTFFAAYATGQTPALPADTSLVNAWRWMLDTALGAGLAPLPSTHYVSSFERPYRFERVP